MAANGVYLSNDVFLRADGRLFMLVNKPGGYGQQLGDVDWEAVGDFSSDIFDKVIKFKQVSAQQSVAQQQLAMQQQLAAQRAAQPGGVQGLLGMDSTTLLMIVGAVLLFMSMPKK